MGRRLRRIDWLAVAAVLAAAAGVVAGAFDREALAIGLGSLGIVLALLWG